MVRPRFTALAGAFFLAFTALSIVLPTPSAAQLARLVDADGAVNWNRFYTASETNQILREFAGLYPELTKVYSVGESYRGQPLMLMEITNQATGPAEEKPALYVDGGIHAGELTGSAVATYLVGHLLNGYGDNARITELLDTRVFYVRPKFNPDGADLALIDDQWLRSTTHPVDEDEDGVADEDPPEDLDGDGWITQMRSPNPSGMWVADPTDNRVLIRDRDGSLPGKRYDVVREGIDNDGDGSINEDGIGGIDMNRNFPRNWERWHLQPGAGNYPLSEPETRAAVEFIDAHRNITGIVHGHTSGGFVFRLPSASAPSLFPAVDLEMIVHLGEEYTRTTGRPVIPSATHPTEHRYGTLISWGFWDHGIVGWVPEYSPGPDEWVTDYDGNGEASPAEQHRFNEEQLGGRYFSDWTAFDHPQLGAVEIGGWHTKFWGQNPPAEFLEAETEKQMSWILYLAESSPLLEVTTPTITPQSDGTYRIDATVTNAGFLPTNLTDRGMVGRDGSAGTPRLQVVRAPAVTLEVRRASIVEGTPRITLLHLAGSNTILQGATENSQTTGWTVRPIGDQPEVRLVAQSDKGGTVRSAWVRLR